MITPVANSAKPISERKKTRSRMSITPRWKPSKCVTTEKAATVSTSAGLAQRVMQIRHRVEAGEDEEEANHHRQDECHDLVSRHGGGHAA